MVCAALLLPGGAANAQTGGAFAWDDGSVPFVVTPMEIVERMLRMAEVGKGDTVIDLGSGDGRIVIEAAKRGARGLGVEIDKSLVALAEENARKAGVADLARFEARDLFQTDLSAASVVTLYLLPELNAKLMPRLLALRPGTRIVSHDALIGDWPPDERLEMRAPEKAVGDGFSRVDLWIVPAQAAGTWTSEVPEHGGRWRFAIGQKYQQLDIGASAAGGRDVLVRTSRLRGSEIKIVVTGIVGGRAWQHLFTGTIDGDRISGRMQAADGNAVRTFPWQASRAR